MFKDADADLDQVQSAYLDFIQAAFVDNALNQSGTDIGNIWQCYVSEMVFMIYCCCNNIM